MGDLFSSVSDNIVPLAIGAGGGALLSALLGGGGSAEIPAPPAPPGTPARSPEEQQLLGLLYQSMLQDVQSQIASRAAVEAALGKPLEQAVADQVAQAKAEREAFVSATGMTPEQYQGQQAAAQAGLLKALNERYLKGANLQLPVPEGVTQERNRQLNQLLEWGRRQFGPGFETAGPFIQARAEFDQRWNALEQDYKAGLAREAEAYGTQMSPAVQQVSGAIPQALATAGAPGANPLLYRSTVASLPTVSPLLQAYGADRGMAFELARQGYGANINYANTIGQANLASALQGGRDTAGLLAALIGAGGTLGAASLGRGPRSVSNYYVGAPGYAGVGYGGG